MPDKIELTEEELQAKIQEAVKQANAELKSTLEKQHNSEMADLRIKAKTEKEQAVNKAIADANLTAEEKAKKEFEEQRKAELEELEQLRLEKKINDRSKKLVDKGLPEFFKNDARLINAEDGKVDEVIAILEKEFKSVLPKGATTSTNVSGGGNNDPADKFAQFRKEGLQK